jgi:general secretion pathway protein G
MTSARSGFSIIEIMVVIAIAGMIMAVAIPNFMKYRKEAKITTTKATLRTLEGAIDSFHSDTGSYPVTLRDLVEKPFEEKVAKRWTSPYLKKEIADDSFNNPIQYQVTKGQKHPYELYSYGPNGEGSPRDEWIDVWEI